MGFDDLPIPNNGSVYNESSPLGLATVANYTKNPILDIGYQCKDMRPYFAFKYSSTTYYTRVNPVNFSVNDQIGVYSASTITKDGLTYTKMTRLSGKATVLTINPSFTISYNNQTYTYDSSGNQDVFINKLNPWSFYKPYEYTGIPSDPEYGQTRCNDILNSTHNWDTYIYTRMRYGFDWNGQNNGVYCQSYTDVLTRCRNNNSVWSYTRPSTIFRLTDFIGYNKNAMCPGSSPEWSWDKKIRKVGSSHIYSSYEYHYGDDYEIDFLNIHPEVRTDNWYVGAIISHGGQLGDYVAAGRVNTLFPTNHSKDFYEATIEHELTHGEGDYDIFWVLSKRGESSVASDGPFIILPYGYSKWNYRLMNRPVTILTYGAVFTSTYPSATLNNQFFDIDWSTSQPARSKDDIGGKVIDEQLSYYSNLKFFFEIANHDEVQSRSVVVTIETELGGLNGVPVYKVEKNIQNIPPNSQYNIGINVPFDRSSSINDPQKLGLGQDYAGDRECGLGFKVYFQIDNVVERIYLDIVNNMLTLSNPGYQYLYDAMSANSHWLLSPSDSYIWSPSGYLNSYAPVLDDNSIVFI